jgi:hypothetical protein
MILIPATINASPIEPKERHVNQVLCLLHDPRYRPIYIHCDLGRDRAMLIAGLYGMYYRGMSKDEAYRDMKRYGFKDDWTLRGLKSYFEKHSQAPIGQYVPPCSVPPPPEQAASESSAAPETRHQTALAGGARDSTYRRSGVCADAWHACRRADSARGPRLHRGGRESGF